MWMHFSSETYNPGSYSPSNLIEKYSEFYLKETENYKMIYLKICRQKAHLKQNTMLSFFSSPLWAEWNAQKHIHNRSKSFTIETWFCQMIPISDKHLLQDCFEEGRSSIKVTAETCFSRTMCHLQPRQSTVK